jgi:cbb3-type cytochrome oxidase subunit 3
MKRLSVTLLLCFIAFLASAKNGEENYIAELNKAIDNKKYYDEKKEQKINSLKQLLNMPGLFPLQEYEINMKLSCEYKKYMMDSAIHYMEKNAEIAKKLNNADLINETSLHLSFLYSATGMYIESKNILKSIDRQALPEKLLILYFETSSQFYGHYAQSNNRHTYYRLNEDYRDSLLTALDPNSMRYRITYAEKVLYQGQVEIAGNRLLELLDEIPEDNSDYALVTYLLGNVYNSKHDSELRKKYYTLSAITDIKNSIKDNASLQSLALSYYEDGDVDQAYKFTKSAIEDAVFCNVRFRTIEISEFYSIINTAYLAKEQKQKSGLQLYLILISVLSLFLITGVIYVYKQMKRVSRIQEELYRANVKLIDLNQGITDTNGQLKEVNNRLSESNHVKEEYIAHFFDICSTYISKLENYRKSLNKKAANNQLDDLFKMLKSTTFVDNELEELYKNFDNIFLSLYPTFVEDFNSLLIKKEQVVLKPGELLNTELRIFALIRLGITDSVKIAGFLRYSLSTIYNYRTKARNKAAVSRDEFESMVMKIGII